jgi:gp32 DNA binding protein like
MANTSFSQLKRSSKSSLEKLNSELAKLEAPKQGPNEDNRFWKPEVDKAGNGYAVIRFLPAPQNEDVPFVRIFDHGFQGPNGWYIEKSLTTLGQKDPVSEYNSQLWATGTKENQATVRKQKRRLSFISNIYVVSDSKHPENEGKVFLYQYGKKIWDKLNAAMNPEFEDETPINPFDLWEGANFKLKIRNVEGYRNYDKSEFEAPAPLADSDEQLEEIWKTEHSLTAFVDPKEFKSYDDLKARLYKVLGLDGSTPKAKAFEDDDVQETPAPKQKAKAPKQPDLDEDEGDEGLDFFRKLAEEEK